MVVVRNVNEIILSLIDFYKLAQPDADTKPGSVIRDLLIDAPANQLALLYDELSKVSIQQSLRLVVGSDLDKLAKNFGIIRKIATPSTGIALITFSSIPATIAINSGDLVIASNGLSYKVLSGVSVSPSLSNFYKSIATKFQNDLTFVGISDQYAVEVTVQATTAGIQGDISKYALSRTTIAGASNVTNVAAFSGGSNQEDDSAFRNRILAVFNGSSVGTALGYKNVALSTTGVNDALVIEPGDVLMTRDGTITETDSEGNITVISEGSGGKVDVVILGSNLAVNTDSFIYRDASNNNDPTNSKNDFVLGQIAEDFGKTINRKRIDDIKNGVLPAQPVENLTQVTGSLSGANFKPKTVDSLGRVSGNYELVKDSGVYAGSPFGFDTFKWVSDRISYNEDRIKGQFNGQDITTFSDVLEIPSIQQNISITNENSIVLSTDRTLIQLLHTPVSTVTRVFNVNTGERYTIVNQNPNGSGTVNTSGIIKISGNTLPVSSDVLQVDYNWIVTFDQYSDYDGKKLTFNLRDSVDSIDWGYSNQIRNEIIEFTKSGTFFQGISSLPVSSIISANVFSEIDAIVTTITSGPFTNRLSVTLNKLFVSTETIDNIYWKNNKIELYNTSQNDGSFSNSTIVIGINLFYVTTIILPSDTPAVAGDKVTVIFNSTDIYNGSSVGSFTNNQITIPTSNYITSANNLSLRVNYIANVQNVINTGITSLPFSRIGNGFVLNNSLGFNNFENSSLIRKENQTIKLNLSAQLYIDLNLTVDSLLIAKNIISVIRLSDGLELWNNDNPGTITSSTLNYQLIFSGYNTPAAGDNVLVIYTAADTTRFQPFTFYNKVFGKEFNTLQYDIVDDVFIINLHTFITESSISFQILEPNTDIVLASGSDGSLIADEDEGLFTSSVNFNTVLIGGVPVDITSKKIRILNASVNNNGIFDIISYNSGTNTLTISNDFSNIDHKQISVIRIADGKDIWVNGEIDGNQLLIPKTDNASALDKVVTIYSNLSNIKQAPTKLSINIADQTVNTGVLSISGTTVNKAQDIVFVSTTSGLKQNLLSAVKKALSLNSNVSVPSNVQLVKIAKLERVTTTTSDDVLLVRSLYDLVGTQINDNTFYGETFIENTSLSNFDFILPNTSNNINNLKEQLSSGDKFRVTFYYSISGDVENVNFTRNGTLYTNKVFGLIDKVYISSGLNSSQSTKLTIGNFNQPITGSRYKVFYDYLGPKQNERIIIQYNYNKLISDVTFNIENSRPINADVIARQAKSINVDVIMNIVVSNQYLTSTTLVKQNVTDKIISTINANGLGTILEASSLVTTAFTVDGVAGARIIYFNKDEEVGQVLRLKAQSDQYFVANSVTINQETV